MGVEFEREAADTGIYSKYLLFYKILISLYLVEQLSEDDISILWYFKYQHKYCVTEAAFNALPHVFPKAAMPTFDNIKSHINFLSGFEPIIYDCCKDSCCCFTG